MPSNIIAFDLGKKGGIAFCHGDKTAALPMPTKKDGDLDLAQIWRIIITVQPELAVIEQVASRPGQGVVSMFTFGRGYGQIEGLLAAYELEPVLVIPQTWKAKILPGTKKDKQSAIDYCYRQFPEINLILPGRRTAHDGMADALCILDYGRRLAGQQAKTRAVKMKTVVQVAK